MRFELIDEIIHDPTETKLNKLYWHIKHDKALLENMRDKIRERKIQIGRLEKVKPVDLPFNETWLFTQLAGGNRELAAELKIDRDAERKAFFDRLAARRDELDMEELRYIAQQEKLRKQEFQYKALGKQFESGESEIHVTHKDIAKELETNNCYYRPGSLKLKQAEDQEHVYRVSITYNSTIASDVSSDNKILIYPVIVDFCMDFYDDRHEVRIRAVPGESNRVTGYGGHNVLHPHMTSPTEPCLGDYGPPIVEALSELDIPTAASIMLFFLGSYDSSDAAGRHGRFFPVDPFHRQSWEAA